MLFLLNDVILSLAPQTLTPPIVARQFSALRLPDVTRLGQEVFAEEPMLVHKNMDRARRLAMLIVSKAPEVNAALFAAMVRGGDPSRVGVRYASVDLGVLARLYERQQAGALTAAVADREVWGRIAA